MGCGNLNNAHVRLEHILQIVAETEPSQTNCMCKVFEVPPPPPPTDILARQ